MLLASFYRAVAVSSLIFSLAGPAGADSGLLLKQTSARYGAITCMATSQNFRMDASELRVFLRPPFKNMDMYNMSSKTRLTCPIDVVGKDIDWRVLNAREMKEGAVEEILPRGNEMLQTYKLDRFLIDLKIPHKANVPKLDFWTTREKDFPQELNNACCTLTGLPAGYGFPVRMYSYQQETSRSGRAYKVHFRVLDTTKVTKQEFPPTTFAQPKGFHPVKDLMELMVSGEQTQ